jgi:6-phosphofructokinase 1
MKAVEYSADAKNSEGSVVMTRVSNDPYKIETSLTALANVARETKHLAPEYINAEGNNITEAFVKYAKPLVGAMPVIGSFEELK